MKKTRLFLVVTMVLAVGCSPQDGSIFDPKKHDLIDPRQQLSRDDYRNMAAQRLKEKEGPPETKVELGAVKEPPIPDVAQILATPRPPEIGETQLVSIAVTDDVPLKDVLIELARLADVDVELDAGIAGGVAFRAKDRPFNEVIDRLSDLAGLRYSMKNGVLRVERDAPYIQSYPLDFLNMERSGTSSININTNVLSSSSGGGGSDSSSSSSSSSSGGGGGGLNSGSKASISAKAEGDFWKSLDDGIKEILSYKPAERTSGVAAPLAPANDPFTAQPEAIAAAGANGAAATEGRAAPVQAASVPAAATGATQDAGGEKTSYTINRQAGVLTVSATSRQHRLIQTFLDKIRRNASSQVLIEAKIVEVTLSDEYRSGIDWSKLGRFNISNIYNVEQDATSQTAITFNFGGINLEAAVNLAETFGTTRTLSSPRLHATNNQQAVLTFAKNQVFFELDVERDRTTSSATQNDLLTVDSTIRTVPIGIILSMQPSIDVDNNEVTLNVRPTLSRITGFVNDPAVAFLVATQATSNSALQGIKNEIPIVEVRELDSILKLKSGQVMVIGGLMEQRGNNEDKGVPGVSEVPFIGNAFKSVTKENTTTELVLFIRATIVGTNGNAAPADKAVYEKFIQDPRPIAF